MMAKAREHWRMTPKDSKNKTLLKMTQLCFHTYCSPRPVPVSQQAKFMGVSRSQYHKKWQRIFNTVMDDFNELLAKEEVVAINKYYRRAKQ